MRKTPESPKEKKKKSGNSLGVLLTIFSLLVGSAAFFAVEQPWEPTTQARWLLRLSKPALALEVLGPEDAKTAPQRALAFEALGKNEELAKLIKARCVSIVSGLDKVDRDRLKLSFAGCH